MRKIKITLDESEIPTHWYNVAADLLNPPPPVIHPGRMDPVGPDDLAPLFPMPLIEQEVSTERWIEIPDEIREALALWRPTPLYRARRLEETIGGPARIYYKNEGVSPAGSHKPNTAVAQAYYNKISGVKRLATETGAGQWGSALSMAGCMFGLEVVVYMVRVSYQQKPYRRNLIETWGGKVHPSPTDLTEFGRAMLAKNPDHPGSLGIAISEAVGDALSREDTKYSLGSVLNHVCLHQTVIGQELRKQLELIGEKPDVLIGCCGGGSNFAGLAFPFVPDKLEHGGLRLVAAEPAACPTLTKGPYTYDFGDSAMTTPLTKMFTLGHNFIPPGIHAGGLRYHGEAAQVSQLVHEKIVEAASYHQLECFEAAVRFARSEGIVPAPESAHAIRAAIDEAQKAKEEGKETVIVFNLSGHGHFDMSAYDAFFSGKLEDYEYSQDLVDKALAELPKVEGY